MPYIKTSDRNQMRMRSLDSEVGTESIARIIDAFVDSLDLAEYGVKKESYAGRPAYDPKGLFKLYIYGHREGIRSSRKLAKSCETNIEVRWLLSEAEPDFRTISDFRKENIGAMKKIFHEFNRRLSGAVEWGFTSVDGTKIRANNAKDNNFTANKLDDRIRWLDAHTEEYLRVLNDMDEEEEETEDGLTREVIEERLKKARERLERYEGYRKVMEETGVSQMSLTDAEAMLMKSRTGFEVAYNPQTAVDSETHIIRDFNMTNHVTDHGLLAPTLEHLKEEMGEEILETVADRGYENGEDMIKCLEQGIIPHVITEDGKDGYELETGYRESEADEGSRKPEDLSEVLHSGRIPEAYRGVIEDIKVEEVRRFVPDEDGEKQKSLYGTETEMMERAREGYFVRDPERNLVYCPGGEILRQKCIKSNGNIRYSNKTACRHCKNRNKCYKGKNEWKEIDFRKDCLEKPCRDWLEAEGRQLPEKKKRGKGHYERIKVVRFFLKPDRKKTMDRMCLSEHPFGTIKRSMGMNYFLLEGLQKVEGEFALTCLGYNIGRAVNLLGFRQLMEIVKAG